ncbi:glycoside hydrolase family 2 protein [Pedobacter miscanthi]|uniref:Beta-galactosidase n=1 Tax=Pedobacter miscanthi TaxID=2259170 RepID=A0A366LEI6_9SPHI|nr:glycoside hydrolase family 2 TIM barrel-domain containing protein [Pedobacter miscanthi]RBQ11893.1 beta-galactosidase [Pedobacter miscanthi]
MKYPIIKLFVFCLLLSKFSFAQFTIRHKDAIMLNGEWRFAMDPRDVGEKNGWYKQATKANWDKVTVPHCFSVDKRYLFYTGNTWYKRVFTITKPQNKRIILHFDAAYYLTTLYLNDKKIGTHEGGYTPFSFDVTDDLKDGENTIAVSVDNNTWKEGTIPGSKDYGEANDPFMGWINYGGLNRPVYLTIEPEVYLKNLKITATPDLKKGTAKLFVRAYVENPLNKENTAPKFEAGFEGKNLVLKWKTVKTQTTDQTVIYEAEANLSQKQVKLWNIDEPNLYQLKAVLGGDTLMSNFGIRKIEVKAAQLLLNGQPIKFGGANRVVDYPGLGALEPDSVVEKDFRLMKEGGMILQRLTHYTPGEYFYELADKYGMLIITEAGNWQLTPNQMKNETFRSKFKDQLLEMMHRDWNHPSVFAYSVGNEYASGTPEGQSWTKDMIDFGRKEDPSRLFTFATLTLNSLPKTPEAEASQYCDFVSTNTYGGHAKILDNIHRLYPDKPVLISEWGVRADQATEAGQVKHIEEVAQIIRERPYVIGASWWSYNDYQSRHVGTNPNGYRPWGLVMADRSPRPGYFTYQKEMSPITVKVLESNNGTLKLQVSNKNDFPYQNIQNYSLKTASGLQSIPSLKPGESTVVEIKGVTGDVTKIEVLTPNKFVIYQETVHFK